MKTKITIAILLLTVLSVVARIITPFRGWNQVDSTDVIVAVAKDPTPPTPGFAVVDGPRFDFGIKVLSLLKGTNDMHFARLQTDHELKWGQAYLIFGDFNNGIYHAYEDYRVVPLGIKFKQEMIAGKPLNEQLQILFQLGVDYMNDDIAKRQAEKQRLEAGLKK